MFVDADRSAAVFLRIKVHDDVERRKSRHVVFAAAILVRPPM
jgi:hypothetical protein